MEKKDNPILNLIAHLFSYGPVTNARVCIVKTVVFPVAMYGCKSWTIKKAERRRIDAFKLLCWKRLESPLDFKGIKSVHLQENQP